MRAYARNTDPSTSHEATTKEEIARLESKAWGALKRHGGWLTYFEWSEISGIKYASLTPRGIKLWEKGRVKREKRPGYNDLGVLKNLLHFKAIQ